MLLPPINIHYPEWLPASVDWNKTYRTDEEKMLLAIGLSRGNVERDTGGPFGAAVFSRRDGRLISIGVNLVVPNRNSVLHGEIVALMMAQARLEHFSLRQTGQSEHELATSCEPCAMCLGATLWSGVTRLICGAHRDDAEKVNFDEGPVFPESYEYLRAKGIEVVREVCRPEAAAVLELYQKRQGVVYNA